MTVNASQLLKRLEPAVRPAAAPLERGSARHPLETQSFDQLLSLASRGALTSGRQVEVGFEARPPLEAAQLERLAAAADQAQAAGARNPLMLIDGRAFVMDVAQRRLTCEVSGASNPGVISVDAAFSVPSDGDARSLGAVGPPGPGVIPSSIAKQLHAPGNQAHLKSQISNFKPHS